MTPTPPATTRRWGLSIPLGEAWFDLPVSEGPTPTPGALASRVDARLEQEPELAPHRDALLDMLAHFTRDAHDQGAMGAALYWKRHDLDVVAAATLYTTVVRREEGPVEDEVARLRGHLGERHATDHFEPVTEVRTVSAGPALRVQVLADTTPLPEAIGEGVGVLETVQYWIPVPDRPATLLLTFATPNLAAAEHLVAEFDQIAHHLTIQA